MKVKIKDILQLKRDILEAVIDVNHRNENIQSVFDEFLEGLEEKDDNDLDKKLKEISEKCKDIPIAPYRQPRISDYPLTSPNGPTCKSDAYVSIRSDNPEDWPTATFSSSLSTGVTEDTISTEKDA